MTTGTTTGTGSGFTPEKEMTLGEFLRHERERRGITIEQVASATKVGVKTLHSLEADQFIELPAKPFIRGFVTSYCRFIGLDSKDILSRYEDFIQQKSLERPNREGGHSGYAFEKKDGEQQSRTILLIAIVSFIVVGGLAVFFLKPSLKHHRHSHVDKLRAARGEAHSSSGTATATQQLSASPSPLSSPSVVSAGASEKATPSETPAPSASLSTSEQRAEATISRTTLPEPSSSSSVSQATPSKFGPGQNPKDPLDSGHELQISEVRHKAVFKTLADVWVRYQVDGLPERKFIVRKGKTLILRGKESVKIQVSNPKSVTYSYNGKSNGALSHSRQTVIKQGVPTLFLPHELAEKTEKPFEDDKVLPETSDPVVDSVSSSPSPSP